LHPEPDAYRVLNIRPDAHDAVLHAAYRALARVLHPDSPGGDAVRMVALNRAYQQVRTPELRQAHDRRHRFVAVGPGNPAPPPVARSRDPDRIDFGRYAGWHLRDLVRHDPDYLRWLSRHSSGVRFRDRIVQLLGESDLGRNAAAVNF
jgi:curved DNA-binding protein CbpA